MTEAGIGFCRVGLNESDSVLFELITRTWYFEFHHVIDVLIIQ
jgi:hypothetical protein